MNDRLIETDRQTQRKTDRDFGSVWPRTDKTINRSNPPPAYSPESHWPGLPCTTKHRDTMRQKVRDREREKADRWRRTEKWERRKVSFWRWFFFFMRPFSPSLPADTSSINKWLQTDVPSLWEVSVVSLGQSRGSCRLLGDDSVMMQTWWEINIMLIMSDDTMVIIPNMVLNLKYTCGKKD